jgi:hypothetical protein
VLGRLDTLLYVSLMSENVPRASGEHELNVLSVLKAHVHFASSFPGQLTDHVAVQEWFLQ